MRTSRVRCIECTDVTKTLILALFSAGMNPCDATVASTAAAASLVSTNTMISAVWSELLVSSIKDAFTILRTELTACRNATSVWEDSASFRR